MGSTIKKDGFLVVFGGGGCCGGGWLGARNLELGDWSREGL